MSCPHVLEVGAIVFFALRQRHFAKITIVSEYSDLTDMGLGDQAQRIPMKNQFNWTRLHLTRCARNRGNPEYRFFCDGVGKALPPRLDQFLRFLLFHRFRVKLQSLA